ncbi:hypothetical protein I4U23_004724 [Adineta vaga]|nr:hypothetical protein I4U23_004724 [Adineta vaga]
MSCCKYLNDCRRHEKRYSALKIFYAVELLTFIIRFIVICIDLSNKTVRETNATFSAIIFILECIASVPLILSNLVYFCISLCPREVPDKHYLRTYLYPRTCLRFSMVTCFDCKCYHEHPAGIHLTRLAILVVCFCMRFTAFILGALCATKFNPICVPYTVLSSVFLILSLAALLIEMLHFHVFWNFRPFNNESDRLRQRARGFLKYVPYNMIYTERVKLFDITSPELGCQCDSTGLAHTILYHSATLLPKIPLPPVIDGKVIVAYHITTNELAIEISKNGFPLDEHKAVADYIYFTLNAPLAEANDIPTREAIIYVRLCLDHVLQVSNETEFYFNLEIHKKKTPEPKALELMPERRIKVKFPRQIENWIIVFLKDENKDIHPIAYQGLI